MSEVMELKPIECETCLYDANGRFLGKYNPSTGRGMFAHTFFVDERTCTMRGSYGIGVEHDPLEGWTCRACGSYVDVEDFNFDELHYCPNCGARVVSE